MKLRIKVTYKIRSTTKEQGMILKDLSNLSGVSISEINDIEKNLHDAKPYVISLLQKKWDT